MRLLVECTVPVTIWWEIFCGCKLTFVKMPPDAPEEMFTVLIFATKPCIVQCTNWAVKKLLAFFYFCGSWIICENRKSLHHVEISLHNVPVFLLDFLCFNCTCTHMHVLFWNIIDCFIVYLLTLFSGDGTKTGKSGTLYKPTSKIMQKIEERKSKEDVKPSAFLPTTSSSKPLVSTVCC